jgi:hypothetical protein
VTVANYYPLTASAWQFSEMRWSRPAGVISQRTEFTNANRRFRLGAASRWSLEADLVPTRDPDVKRLRRSEMDIFSAPENTILLQMFPNKPQGSIANGLVKGSGQAGFSLVIDNLPASTLVVKQGWVICVSVGGLHHQALVVSNNATTNGSGETTLNFTTPLRASPADNGDVHIQFPFIMMNFLDDVMGWKDGMADITEAGGTIKFVESF